MKIPRVLGPRIPVGMLAGETRWAEHVSRAAASDSQARLDSHRDRLKGLFWTGFYVASIYMKIHLLHEGSFRPMSGEELAN